jgi:hypothetical protein
MATRDADGNIDLLPARTISGVLEIFSRLAKEN